MLLVPAGDLPLPTIGVNDQYKATIERNHEGITEEITEFYDGLSNIGIAVQVIVGSQISSYCYYGLNEAYFVSDYRCVV